MTKFSFYWTDIYMIGMVAATGAWSCYPFIYESFRKDVLEARLVQGLAVGLALLAGVLVCMVCIALTRKLCNPRI